VYAVSTRELRVAPPRPAPHCQECSRLASPSPPTVYAPHPPNPYILCLPTLTLALTPIEAAPVSSPKKRFVKL